MTGPIGRISNMISRRLDERRDIRICGTSLGGFVPTPYAESHGATGSQSAPYPGLQTVLSDLKLTPEDSFIDVGCGKGRVIAYLIGQGAPCRITGVELNPEVAGAARKWTERYPEVNIITGDAFGLDYNEYTVLFMYRPMETDAFKSFIQLLERQLTHGIRLYYYVDAQSGYYLNERAGWKLIRREEIRWVRGLCIHLEEQRYSVWEYRPQAEGGQISE